MEQRRPVLLAAVALLWAFVLFGRAGAGPAFDVKDEVTSRHGDSLQPGIHTDILDFGPTNGRGKYGIEQKPDLSNIKRVMAAKRDRREVVRDSHTFYPLRGGVTRESTSRDDGAPSQAGILGTLSERGLEYVKDVLVGEILEAVIPLKIADIYSRVNSPIGRLDALVKNIVLESAQVYYSEIDLGQRGVTIYAAGINATLHMHWEYHYTASYVPFPIGDGGWAEVEVSGMQTGVTFTLAEQNGTLGLVVDEAGTFIEDLEIELHGGGSWFYQWFVYAFDYNIRAAVEVALTQKIVDGAEQLDDWLLHLPRSIPIDETSAIDVTVVHDPLLSPTYLSVGAKGEFISLGTSNDYPEPDTELPPGLFCDQSVKMVTIALSDYVLNSAAFVYYDSGELMWDVDTLPGRKYLNTASWKYIIPQLYRKYPNEDMVINFAVSSAPTVDITKSGIRAKAGADMTIEVKDGEAVVPVACINLMVTFDAVASLNYANITAQATLNDLTVALKWSEIGNFHVILVQATVRTIVREVVLPLINLNLKRGFPIPMVAGVQLEDSDLRYEDGYLLVCTDIHYEGGFFKQLKPKKATQELHWNQR